MIDVARPDNQRSSLSWTSTRNSAWNSAWNVSTNRHGRSRGRGVNGMGRRAFIYPAPYLTIISTGPEVEGDGGSDVGDIAKFDAFRGDVSSLDIGLEVRLVLPAHHRRVQHLQGVNLNRIHRFNGLKSDRRPVQVPHDVEGTGFTIQEGLPGFRTRLKMNLYVVRQTDLQIPETRA